MISAIRFFYNLVYPLVLVVLLPTFILHMLRRGKYRHKFFQRFGLYSASVRKRIAGDRRTWVHAVSVGEVMIALRLIHAIRESDAERRFVLSTTTSTGFKVAARAKSQWLEPIYNPLDFYFCARASVRTIRPRQLILVEAEVWPNLVCEARARGARIAMVNTRLSGRSERRYRLLRFLTAPLFNVLDLLCLQEKEDVGRWKGLGVEPQKLLVTGSIKFDEQATSRRAQRDFLPILRNLGVSEAAPVLLGGSTFEGEEEILARVLLGLRKEWPEIFLIIVPRHVERSDQIASACLKMGLRVTRRMQPSGDEKPDILLVDTTGELRDWYACATVVFIGKSLTARGGQNPAEPVASGVPVVFGPLMTNFRSLTSQFLREGGAIEVADEVALQQACARLLRDSSLRSEMVKNAMRCLASHHGATQRTVAALKAMESHSSS